MKGKKLSSGMQIFIGVFSVLIFWLFGMITGDPRDWFYETPFEENFIYKIPDFVFDVLPFVFVILIIAFSLIGKWRDYKKMYWSAFIMTALPFVTSIIAELGLVSDTLLSMLLFPLWILLYPFFMMGGGTYQAVRWNSNLFDYREEWVFIIIGAGLVFSLILFFTVKRKNENNT